MPSTFNPVHLHRMTMASIQYHANLQVTVGMGLEILASVLIVPLRYRALPRAQHAPVDQTCAVCLPCVDPPRYLLLSA